MERLLGTMAGFLLTWGTFVISYTLSAMACRWLNGYDCSGKEWPHEARRALEPMFMLSFGLWIGSNL